MQHFVFDTLCGARGADARRARAPWRGLAGMGLATCKGEGGNVYIQHCL